MRQQHYLLRPLRFRLTSSCAPRKVCTTLRDAANRAKDTQLPIYNPGRHRCPFPRPRAVIPSRCACATCAPRAVGIASTPRAIFFPRSEPRKPLTLNPRRSHPLRHNLHHVRQGCQDLQDQVQPVPHRRGRRRPQAGPQPASPGVLRPSAPPPAPARRANREPPPRRATATPLAGTASSADSRARPAATPTPRPTRTRASSGARRRSSTTSSRRRSTSRARRWSSRASKSPRSATSSSPTWRRPAHNFPAPRAPAPPRPPPI